MIYSEVVTLINIYNKPTFPMISALEKEHTTNILPIIPLSFANSDIPPTTVQMSFFCIKNDYEVIIANILKMVCK
jgi:hypothetical protein